MLPVPPKPSSTLFSYPIFTHSYAANIGVSMYSLAGWNDCEAQYAGICLYNSSASCIARGKQYLAAGQMPSTVRHHAGKSVENLRPGSEGRIGVALCFTSALHAADSLLPAGGPLYVFYDDWNPSDNQGYTVWKFTPAAWCVCWTYTLGVREAALLMYVPLLLQKQPAQTLEACMAVERIPPPGTILRIAACPSNQHSLLSGNIVDQAPLVCVRPVCSPPPPSPPTPPPPPVQCEATSTLPGLETFTVSPRL